MRDRAVIAAVSPDAMLFVCGRQTLRKEHREHLRISNVFIYCS